MSPEVSERSFEEAIECGLLQHGPDACVVGVTALAAPGSKIRREIALALRTMRLSDARVEVLGVELLY